MKKKIIAWENWSEIERDLTDESIILDGMDDNSDDEDSFSTNVQNEFLLSPLISEMKPSIIQTPFGNVPFESKLKPSDRWDCWMGYTNFGITEDVQKKIQEIEGVDALRVMSRYSFCIGVGKMFQSIEVKRDIHNAVCK